MTKKTNALVDAVPLRDTPLALEVAGVCGVPSDSLIALCKNQIISVPRNAPPATDGEMFVVLSVMKAYGMSPMLRQLHVWRDNKGKLCCMVGHDGWVEFAGRQDTFIRVGYIYSEAEVEVPGTSKMCWEWISAVVYDTRFPDGAEQPPTYFLEFFMDTGNWAKYPRRRHPEKAHDNAIRDVYGMSVMDEADAEQVKFMDDVPARAAEATISNVDDLKAKAEEMKERIEKERSGTANKETTPPPIGQAEPVVESKIQDGEYENVPDPEPDVSPIEEEAAGPAEPEPEDEEPMPSLEEFGIAIGERCQQMGCHSDQATFRCEVCQGVYCNNHRSEKPGFICAACGITIG